jgi:hypothetical protein
VKDATGGQPHCRCPSRHLNPTKITNDLTLRRYRSGPLRVNEEPLNATHDIPVSKNIEQTYVTDAQGRYTLDEPSQSIRVSALLTITLIDLNGYSSRRRQRSCLDIPSARRSSRAS